MEMIMGPATNNPAKQPTKPSQDLEVMKKKKMGKRMETEKKKTASEASAKSHSAIEIYEMSDGKR